MKKLYHLFLTFALLSAAGCNDFLDPDDDNSYKGDELLTYIQRAEGVLLNAYASVPNANQISVMTDVATDNAVWNTSSGNAFRNIVSGEWSSTNNPFDKWSSAYTAIGYCNLFLDELGRSGGVVVLRRMAVRSVPRTAHGRGPRTARLLLHGTADGTLRCRRQYGPSARRAHDHAPDRRRGGRSRFSARHV